MSHLLRRTGVHFRREMLWNAAMPVKPAIMPPIFRYICSSSDGVQLDGGSRPMLSSDFRFRKPEAAPARFPLLPTEIL